MMQLDVAPQLVNAFARARIGWMASRSFSCVLVLVASLFAFHGPAMANPADTDEPLLHPRREADPRLDLPEASRVKRIAGARRAPLWFAVAAQLRQQTDAPTSVEAMLLVGLPLERLVHGAQTVQLGEGPPSSPRRAPTESERGASDADASSTTQEVVPPSPVPSEPIVLRPPTLALTPDVVRAATAAALRRAHLDQPEARLNALCTRARAAAALPELRLRALRTVDQGQSLSPTEYDPSRTTSKDGVSLWLEARATWHLDRLVFAEEEVAFERMRHERAEAQTRLMNKVLHVLFEWQRAQVRLESAVVMPQDEVVALRLRVAEAEAELDLITDGWFSHWKAEHRPETPGAH